MIVDTAQVAAGLLARELGAQASAGVAALHLDDEGRLLAATFSPADAGAELPVRDILASALGAGAASVVVGQKAPPGTVEPDAAICDASRRLAEAAAAAGIRLMDHLLFAGEQCRSFRELGLI